MYQKIMTEADWNKLPPLYSQEKSKDPIVWVKFFAPWNQWTWFATEGDRKTGTFFGWVKGQDEELGYFNLNELVAVRGPFGLKIERDMYFDPKPLSLVTAGKDHESYTLSAEEKRIGRKTSAKRLKVPKRAKKSPSGFGGIR